MTISQENNPSLSRSEELITLLLTLTDKLPNIFSVKDKIQEQLDNLRSAIQGLRPPRIMVIGRCRSGKSSLINAICGLKVAEVSDTVPETGKADWKQYYHHGTDLLHILDTRGLQESQAPRQADSAKTPYDSIMQAVNKECPDVVLFLCKATEVHSASKEDLETCELILAEIKKKYRRNLPVIGVLTKCDELSPPRISLPTDNERKNSNIQKSVQNFHDYLKMRENLRHHVQDVVPTVAYAEYEEGKNGLILPDEDERWNITELIETIIKYTPRETRGSLARMAHIQDFQLSVARTIVIACTVLSSFVSANPIPGAAIPVVGVIQTLALHNGGMS